MKSFCPPFPKPKLSSIVYSKDLVIFIATEIHYQDFSFGFIDDAYDVIVDSVSYNLRLNQQISDIKNSTEWLENTKKQAIANNVSVDDMIRLNAEWMLRNEKKASN